MTYSEPATAAPRLPSTRPQRARAFSSRTFGNFHCQTPRQNRATRCGAAASRTSPTPSWRPSTPPSATTAAWRRRISRAPAPMSACSARRASWTRPTWTAILDGLAASRGRDRVRRTFEFSTALEDIHMNVEARLAEILSEGRRGLAAGRLHTARSRNDQVALDFRMWVRRQLRLMDGQLVKLMRAFVDEGGGSCRHRHARLHASADGAARDLRPPLHGLCRDVRPRPRRVWRSALGETRSNVPLGAAALAGTGFPIDREA